MLLLRVKIVSVLLVFILNACALENPQISNFRLSGASLSGGNPGIQLDVQIKNPNSFRIKIKNLQVEAQISGRSVGEVSTVSKLVMPSKSDNYYPFEASVNLKEGLGSAIDILMGKRPKVQLKASGKIVYFLFIGQKFEVLYP
jgi:LEA14-like dessication related protein